MLDELLQNLKTSDDAAKRLEVRDVEYGTLRPSCIVISAFESGIVIGWLGKTVREILQ